MIRSSFTSLFHRNETIGNNDTPPSFLQSAPLRPYARSKRIPHRITFTFYPLFLSKKIVFHRDVEDDPFCYIPVKSTALFLIFIDLFFNCIQT